MKHIFANVLSFLLIPTLFFFAGGVQTLQAATVGDNPGDSTTVGDNPGSDSATKIDNPLGENTSLIGFFNEILDVILIFAVPIIVLFIMFAGFQYVTARGEPEKIKTANKALLYAVIGGVLILGANVLLEVISGTIDALGQ